MQNGTTLTSFLKSLYALSLVPFPFIEPEILDMMNTVCVVHSWNDEEGLLFNSLLPPPGQPPQSLPSVFFSFSKQVWESLQKSTTDERVIRFLLSGACGVYISYSGNRLLELVSPTACVSRVAPIKSVSPFLVKKVECMYRTNWNKRFPLGVSNPIHSEKFETPEEFAKAVILPESFVSERSVEILWTLKQNCMRIKVDALLGITCPLPPGFAAVKEMGPIEVFRTLPIVPNLTVGWVNVVRLMLKLLKQLFPICLWRSGKEWTALVSEFIQLNRFDSIDVSRFFKLGDVPLVVLVVRKILAPLISYCFYVTEGSEAPTTLYLRRPVFDVLASKASLALVDLLGLRPTSQSSPLSAKVRWVPKRAGMRPVVSQCKWVKDRTKKLLRFLASVRSLGHLTGQRSTHFSGCSLLTREECHPRLVQFLAAFTPTHFFTADIQNCFESIPFGWLEEALKSFGNSTTPPSALHETLQFQSAMVSSGRLEDPVRRRRRPVVFQKNNLANLLAQIPANACRPIVISVGPVSDERMSWAVVQKEIIKMVKSAVYRLNTCGTTTNAAEFQVTDRGLPQGSSFSCMLVSLFYDFVDRTLFLPPKDCLLVRLIDDMLCLAPSAAVRDTVLRTVRNSGMYGRLNAEKLSLGSISSPQEKFEWAGFSFHPTKGKLNLSSTSQLTVRRGGASALHFFDSSLGRSIAQWSLKIFSDPNLNSAEKINANAAMAGQQAGRRLRAMIRSAGVRRDETVFGFVKKLVLFVKRRFAPAQLRLFQISFEHALS